MITATEHEEIYHLPHAYWLVYEFYRAGWEEDGVEVEPTEHDIKEQHEHTDYLLTHMIPATYAFLTDEWLMNNPEMKKVALQWANAHWEWVEHLNTNAKYPEERIPLFAQEFITRVIKDCK